MRRHYLAAAALLVLFVIACSIERADAHTLTGASAQATCDAGTVHVVWTYTSGDAGAHTIEAVAFSRPVDSTSHTAATVTAHTTEAPGTVALTATVRFEDGFRSSKVATTTIPDSFCPPATSIVQTTTTTEVTTSTTSALGVAPPSNSPPISPPTSLDATSVAPPMNPPPPGSNVSSSTLPLYLPPTGTSDPLPLAGIAVGLVLVGILLATRKRVAG